MKILQLIPNISGGGAERFTVDLSSELSKEHDVHLVTLYAKSNSDLFREELSDSVMTHALNKKTGFDWRVIIRLGRKINEINPDVIHSHLRSFNYLMLVIPFLSNIPVVHTVHSDAFKECSNLLLRKIRKFCFEVFNVTPVTISKVSSNSFEKAYGKISQELIYNGRKFPEQTNNFGKAQQEINNKKTNRHTKVFIHIGRLQVEKNQRMLVKAFNRMLCEDKINAILLIIGGERNNRTGRKVKKQLAQAEQMYKHIHILGERFNATDYLHLADFFCLSSLYEGMPITLIEAFATKTIPICTPVGGIPEMVSVLDGSLLSESTEVNDYYEALKKASTLKEEKQVELKKRAKVIFEEKYSMKYCAGKYLELYNELTYKIKYANNWTPKTT